MFHNRLHFCVISAGGNNDTYSSSVHCRCSQWMNVSLGIFPFVFLPITLSTSDGTMPDPGRLAQTISMVMTEPSGISSFATRLFLAQSKLDNSFSLGVFSPEPRPALISLVR